MGHEGPCSGIQCDEPSNACLAVMALQTIVGVAGFALHLSASVNGYHPRHNFIRAVAVQAATIYERDGEEALRTYLAGLKTSKRMRAFLLNAQGQPLADPVPRRLAKQIVRYPQWVPPHRNRSGHVAISAVEVHLASGTPYRFIATHRPRPWGRRAGPPIRRRNMPSWA